MGDTGLEPIQESSEKLRVGLPMNGAESGAVLPSELAQPRSELPEIIASWPRLSPTVQSAILTPLRWANLGWERLSVPLQHQEN
jgi:hypothetical protein